MSCLKSVHSQPDTEMRQTMTQIITALYFKLYIA